MVEPNHYFSAMESIDKIRKFIHKNAELSGKEEKTSEYICSLLSEWGVEFHKGFSQYSILAFIKGDSAGKSLLFRSELDALPIQEANDFTHRSIHDGVSHKCGHDGHMSILLGLIQRFLKEDWKGGDLYFLFQSAEETGEGAQKIIESDFLSSFRIDYAISLHNAPGYEKHTVLCKNDVFTPTVKSFKLKLGGATSHAAEPDKGINPAFFIADFIQFMQNLHCTEGEAYFVVAPIFINLGKEAYGVSAGAGEIGFTIRSVLPSFFEEQKERILDYARESAKKKGLTLDLEWLEPFKANINDSYLVDQVKKATQELGLNYIDKPAPFDWGEDFGLFSNYFKTVMFGLGSGVDTPPLHDSKYDFPDEIAETGVNVFFQMAKLIENDS